MDSGWAMVNRVFNSPAPRRFWLKYRILFAPAAVALWLRYADTEYLLVAFCVSLVGEFIQVWCFASLDKRRTLAFNGLYKYVRNPMYLGRLLLVLGYLVLLKPMATIPIAMVLYGFYMVNRVRREEEALRVVFGEQYEAYLRRVNRFLPSLRGMENGRFWYWKWRLFLQNHAPANILAMLGSYALLLVCRT